MTTCPICGGDFERKNNWHVYCSNPCRNRSCKNKQRALASINRLPDQIIRCENCQKSFVKDAYNKLFCSRACQARIAHIKANTRKMVSAAASGRLDVSRSRRYRGRWTEEEISQLRADPLCVLPNRSLQMQWLKCTRLNIPRDKSLFARHKSSPGTIARRRYIPNERTRWAERRKVFRRRVRSKPELILNELRELARGHPHAEDLVIEGFAVVLRDCSPPAEAFKIAKAEVNRTSAQPFREQSFNPDIDYAAQETGRQVARASDIRAARGER